jgi:hypothetical protein
MAHRSGAREERTLGLTEQMQTAASRRRGSRKGKRNEETKAWPSGGAWPRLVHTPAPLQHRRTWRQRSENPYVIADITLVVNHANTAANANSEKYDRIP